MRSYYQIINVKMMCMYYQIFEQLFFKKWATGRYCSIKTSARTERANLKEKFRKASSFRYYIGPIFKQIELWLNKYSDHACMVNMVKSHAKKYVLTKNHVFIRYHVIS